MKDALGSRMKDQYEDRYRVFLPRRTYTMIRVDGKAFHSYTRSLPRPFDFHLMSHMDFTAAALCREAQGAVCAYVQSDEISVLLTDFASEQTDAWFDGNVQKIASISASVCTAEFNRLRSGLSDKSAFFDARAWVIPDPIEVENYFIWRQKDAVRNSIQMVARTLYSHKELHEVGINELQELIFQKGINWNDYPAGAKRGRMVVKTPEMGWQVEAPPIFTQERSYLRKLIPQMPSWREEQADAVQTV
jgi:tRNA(His) guanylyltransferase